MKTSLHHFAAFAVAALLSAAGLRAGEQSSPDRASPSPRLAECGHVNVDAAGPYVERGTWRVQVLAKLGQPDAVLPDGALLYHGHVVPDTELRGTLVIRLQDGRVSQLALATPETITAWSGKLPIPRREFAARK